MFTMDVFSLPSCTRKAEQISYGCTINQGIRFFMNEVFTKETP
ncbi:hypothetical protein CFter6_5290 [Collimonas fungivorans]|uniref:Uncharacterized protein n=2 Tax=Collimonas fungivorans TaxID=158899 RepID=A0A127PJC6_9BURK|nr:hypothetical protein CFter6_5290 [Collimonas fungivorans]